MSREDKISKLFIDNQHKLDEHPGSALWSKIESKMNGAAGTAIPETAIDTSLSASSGKNRVIKFLPYFAAAASLLLLIFVLPLLRTAPENEIAEKIEGVEDIELPAEISEAFPVSESDKDSAFEFKERQQKEKLLQSAKKAASENKKTKTFFDEYGLDRIEMNSTSKDLIVLTLEPTLEEVKSFVAKPQIEFDNNINVTANAANASPIVSSLEYQNDGRPYANPPRANPYLADDIGAVAQKKTSAEAQKDVAPKSMLKNKSLKKNENVQKLEGPMQIFQWMLGNWADTELDGAKSYESWRYVNPYSIEGTGSRMLDKNKIFEEKIKIYFDPALKQVFLKMPIDDYKNSFLYMLSAHDSERIIFEQKENPSLPNKVILQRNLNGFSTIINFDNGIMNSNQQAYLQHRNRVSNTRALRILTISDK